MTGQAYLQSLGVPWRDGFHIIADDELAVEPEYGQMLYDMVKNRKPKIIFELGTARGYSTSWMLLALNELNQGHLYTADHIERKPPYWDMAHIPTNRLTRFKGTVDQIEKVPGLIDLAFLDSTHQFELLEPDLEKVMPRIAKNGTMVVHDTNYYRNMGDALAKYFEGRTEWAYREIRTGCGFGIAVKNGEGK